MDEISVILSREVYLYIASKFKSQCHKYYTLTMDYIQKIHMQHFENVFIGGSKAEGTELDKSDFDVTLVLKHNIVCFHDKKRQRKGIKYTLIADTVIDLFIYEFSSLIPGLMRHGPCMTYELIDRDKSFLLMRNIRKEIDLAFALVLAEWPCGAKE